MKVEKGPEQLLFTTLRIETPSSVGTGFIVVHEWVSPRVGGKIGGRFLITNKHVIGNTNSGRFKLTNTSNDGQNPSLGQSISLTVGSEDWKRWTGHPSDDIDIAALPMEPVLSRLSDKKDSFFFRTIGTDMIVGQDILEDIQAIEDIIFVGYPNGIYDKVNNLPIVRKGITATPVNVDYEGRPIFLIDASVFPGSSGSPVFIYNAGSWRTKKRTVLSGYRLLFVGVLAKVYCQEVDGSLHFRDIPTGIRPVVKTREMIDLGIVYKAHTVLETIEHFLHGYGDLLPEGAQTGILGA